MTAGEVRLRAADLEARTVIHVHGNRERLIDAHRTAREDLVERLAFEQLHRDEQRVAVFANFVDLADVRMVTIAAAWPSRQAANCVSVRRPAGDPAWPLRW